MKSREWLKRLYAVQPFVQDEKRQIPILVNSDQVPLHISISSLHERYPTRLAICIRPPVLLSRGSNVKSQFPAARTPNDSRWRYTVRMCARWKPFSRCARENSASRVTYQPQSDMIPRALGMWYIIYQMPQILFLLMADAWGWSKKDEK